MWLDSQDMLERRPMAGSIPTKRAAVGNRKYGLAALFCAALTASVLVLSAGSSASLWPPESGSKIATGDAYSCTVRVDGTLACWGDDSEGQVSGTPEGEFLSVSAGGAHACAIRVDHTLACWGDDSSGQVGEAPEGEFLSVSAGGAHACAIRVDHTLACWGDDSEGQASGTPEGEFLSVSAGGAHACAIRVDHTLACWGDDSEGQASVSDLADKLHKHHNDNHHPHDKDYPPPFLSVAAGGDFTCARYADGDLLCWGDDSSGQVGEAPEGDFLSVSAGGAHACAVRYDGDLLCWGDDSSGQVGEAPEGEFLSVSAGGAHSCAIRAGGSVACWGDNEAGQVQPLILPPGPPEGTVDSPYAHAFETTPQYPHPAFGLAGGSLPDGLELGADGTLSGTPTAAGTFPFVLAAANGALPDAEAEETVKIAPAPEALAPPVAVVSQAPEGLPPPTAGKTVNVKPAGGTVQIKCPGEEVAHLLSPEQIPIECLIDVRRGTVDLESATGSGTEVRSGFFWGGVFGVLQKAEDDWETELRLAGRLKCEKRKGKSARASRRTYKRGKSGGRKLWGSGKGNFKTSGNYGSASVRGTIWLVVDRCDNSTLFRVREGTVWVNDFVKEKAVVLTQGEQYVAKAAIPRLK
jgi:hypothetical protein